MASTAVLHDPSLYQFSHKGGRQRLVCLKADGALAGVIVLELVLVGFHCGRTHQVERAVVRCRTEGYEHSLLTESSEPVADALFSVRRGGPDSFSKFLECGSLVIAQSCEIFIDGLGFTCHR